MTRLPILCALALLPAVAAAQTNVATALDHVTRAPAGTWAEYSMSRTGAPRTLQMRTSLVSRSRTLIALEVSVDTPMGKILTRSEYVPDGADWKIKRAFVKMGDRPASAMPTAAEGAVIKKGEKPGKPLGVETITTKAGTFSCKHYKRKDPRGEEQELWISDKAHPTGLVKLVAKGGMVELIALGKGAKPSLDVSKVKPLPAGAGKAPTGEVKVKGKTRGKSKAD